jgi:ribose/xylose/arabinose/galactoside ABC-type transport system permease subunit
LGKLLLTLGVVIAVVGVVLILAGKFNISVGRLPGDIVYRGKNTVFYFPLVTCLVTSILLSLVLWLINRGRH